MQFFPSILAAFLASSVTVSAGPVLASRDATNTTALDAALAKAFAERYVTLTYTLALLFLTQIRCFLPIQSKVQLAYHVPRTAVQHQQMAMSSMPTAFLRIQPMAA